MERETHNLILKFREISHEEKLLRADGMKSDEKHFFCQIYASFEKNCTFCDSQVFFKFLKGFKDFS